MRFSSPVFHSGLANVFSRVHSVQGDRSDALFAVSMFFFIIYFCLFKVQFLYILLHIEIPCTILFLHMLVPGRAYIPTQEKKRLRILEN